MWRGRLKIRRQLFLLQIATLGIVTAGAIGGWATSVWIGQGPRLQAERLAAERDYLAHMGFNLLGAVPHSGQYLGSTPQALIDLIHHDIGGLRRFQEELDAHMASANLSSADPELHRELETIRLLSVQLEQNLGAVEREIHAGHAPSISTLETTIRDPTIGLIRRHADRLASLHDKLDERFGTMVEAQRRALRLGLTSWISLLLAAWVIGLLLTWRTGERLLQPLVRLERLMRQPPREVEAELETMRFDQAPGEIASLSRSFHGLVREVRQLLGQLEDQLRTDGLTSVGNRRHFDAMFEHEWHRALRSHEPLSLLLLDVDHFKLYNDHYGHPQGDRCLKEVAQAILVQVRRRTDVVCRIGGEEFAVLLPDTAIAEAAGVANGIVRAIDALTIEHLSSPVADRVTASIGVACCVPSEGLLPSGLMELADGALYRRKKRQGRHGVSLAPAVGSTASAGAGDQGDG